MSFQKMIIICSVIIAFFAMLWFIVGVLIEEPVHQLQPQNGYIFEYVIVGAGTAGSVLAALLSKVSPTSTILLVEAGDKFGVLSKVPLLTTFQQQGVNDWAFLSVPQQHSSKGLEKQQQSLPRGKGLGGSAQLNYMLHFDGEPADFDHWATAYNLSIWHSAILGPMLAATRAHRHEMLEILPQYSQITEAFHQAASEFEHKPWRFRRAIYNIKNGLRHSTYQRFLQPSLKKSGKPSVLLNAMVRNIKIGTQFNGEKIAYAVEIGIKKAGVRKERRIIVEIEREVLLCAGAYQSPQLLLASGIGPPAQLASLKIPIQHELPRVGANLHDHLNLPLYVSLDVAASTLNQRTLLNPLNLLRYLTAGTGPYGNFGVLAHVDSSYEEAFSVTCFGVGAIDEAALRSISNFKRGHFRALFPRYHNTSQEGFVLISTCLQPQSRGTVRARSANIRQTPLIDPNYLSAPADVSCTIKAVRAAVELMQSQAFAMLRPRIHWPKIKECANFGPFERDFQLNVPSDRYLECVMRHVALGSHHPGGTCAMGTSPEASVVDQQFRVHGVRNLRVIDASVLPTPISGYPNSVIAGLATRAVAMVLAQKEKPGSRVDRNVRSVDLYDEIPLE